MVIWTMGHLSWAISCPILLHQNYSIKTATLVHSLMHDSGGCYKSIFLFTNIIIISANEINMPLKCSVYSLVLVVHQSKANVDWLYSHDYIIIILVRIRKYLLSGTA